MNSNTLKCNAYGSRYDSSFQPFDRVAIYRVGGLSIDIGIFSTQTVSVSDLIESHWRLFWSVLKISDILEN